MQGVSDYDKVMDVLGKNCLFYVERSIDREIVVYEAKRDGTVLNSPFVDNYWTNINLLHKREAVSKRANSLFFGVEVKKQKHQYKMYIYAIPTKIITLHLKKSGKTVAKSIINGKEAKIFKIYVNIENSSSLIPVVTSLTIYGEHKKRIVSEEIKITDDIRNRFDVSSFLPNLSDWASVF
jgi:hypothetical protein